MEIGRILPGIAIISGRIFVCGGEVDSRILANGEVRHLENFVKKYRVATMYGLYGMSDPYIVLMYGSNP